MAPQEMGWLCSQADQTVRGGLIGSLNTRAGAPLPRLAGSTRLDARESIEAVVRPGTLFWRSVRSHPWAWALFAVAFNAVIITLAVAFRGADAPGEAAAAYVT